MTMFLALASLRHSTASDRRAVRRQRRSRSRRGLDLEALENRLLLTRASTSFARLIAPITVPGERTAIPVLISPDDFALRRCGRVILGFVSHATGANPFHSSPVHIVSKQRFGARVLTDRGEPPNLTLAGVPAGRLSLLVGTASNTPGSPEVDVFLAGDTNGDFRVDRRDLRSIRLRLGARQGQPRYRLAADVDRNGRIDFRDWRLARVNFGTATLLRPLTVSEALDVESDPDGDGLVNRRDVAVVGQTAPGALVQLDQGGDGSFEQATVADRDGRYRFAVNVRPGATEVQIEAADSLGQRASASLIVRMRDELPPTVRIRGPASGLLTNTNPIVTGQVVDDASGVEALEAQVDTGPLFFVADDPFGHFGFPTNLPTNGSADGSHTVSLRSTDVAGNISDFVRVTFTLDTIAPLAPSLPHLLATSDSGQSPTDEVTNVRTPSVELNAESGTRVHLFVDGAPAGVAEADSNPVRFTVGPLADGVHQFTATAEDQAGNVSAPSGALVVTIDTQAPPEPTFDLAPASESAPVGDHQTRSPVVTLTGQTEPNVAVSLDGTSRTTTADATGKFSLSQIALTMGANAFTIRATDAAGNESTASQTITRLVSSGPLFPDPAPAPINTGSAPNGIASGDLNGDGHLDLVTANTNDDSVSVLLGHGDGTFAPKLDYAVDHTPYSVALRDLNGDGHLDLVTANSGSDSVSVLLGHGDGTFGPRTDYAAGSGAQDVALGDLDGDGHLDLVTANINGDSISVLLGHGDGTFAPHADYATGSKPAAVALGDVNGDGHLDVVTANDFGGSVSVLLGQGDGSFGPQTEYPVGPYMVSVALGDVDNNGDLDIVAAEYGPSGGDNVAVLLGHGDGTFAAPTEIPVLSSNPRSVTLGDLNGDGRLDLVVTYQNSSTASVLLGQGGGTFGPRTDYAVASTAREPGAVAVGDVNGDGHLDLAVACDHANSVSVLLGQGDGTFGARTDYPVGLVPTSVALGDLDGDGHLDIIATNTEGNSVSVLLGQGNGSFAPRTDYVVGDGPLTVALGDLNGDGFLDFVTANTRAGTVSPRLNLRGS
jgi:hypothetical protein